MGSKTYIPWVEKYRPTNFKDIVLEEDNRKIFNNILYKKYFPNILLYGPPGTGKTTTIINLINSYQKDNNQTNKGLMIHLNASDDRGIDIIRNQINCFVNSKTLFNCGIKFIILDEVDYMTKNAQLALKHLLQEYKENIRFCLICNYISRIDESLQHEFVRLRFNQLPTDDIIAFLNIINETENLNLTKNHIESIQKNFKSDIRSMINYMQSNRLAIINTDVVSDDIYNNILLMIKTGNIKTFISELHKISITYNIDIKNIIKDYFNYMIRNKKIEITPELLKLIEYIIHNPELNIEYQINFMFYSLLDLIS
jgi:DNA polymerase III delta prime subunit